jgi:hypothetical protein
MLLASLSGTKATVNGNHKQPTICNSHTHQPTATSLTGGAKPVFHDPLPPPQWDIISDPSNAAAACQEQKQARADPADYTQELVVWYWAASPPLERKRMVVSSGPGVPRGWLATPGGARREQTGPPGGARTEETGAPRPPAPNSQGHLT